MKLHINDGTRHVIGLMPCRDKIYDYPGACHVVKKALPAATILIPLPRVTLLTPYHPTREQIRVQRLWACGALPSVGFCTHLQTTNTKQKITRTLPHS